MQVASLTSCPPADKALRARSCRPTEVDLCFIARQLGIIDRPPRTIIDKVRKLAETAAFPLPKTPRFFAGARVKGPRSIDAYSIWDRDPVEAWFDDDRPPVETAALNMVRRNAVAEEMARRAHGLVRLVSNNG